MNVCTHIRVMSRTRCTHTRDSLYCFPLFTVPASLRDSHNLDRDLNVPVRWGKKHSKHTERVIVDILRNTFTWIKRNPCLENKCLLDAAKKLNFLSPRQTSIFFSQWEGLLVHVQTRTFGLIQLNGLFSVEEWNGGFHYSHRRNSFFGFSNLLRLELVGSNIILCQVSLCFVEFNRVVLSPWK